MVEFDPDPLRHVVFHSPAETGIYLGSPSVVRAPDGALVVSHDFFGPGSPRDKYGRASSGAVYRSEDEGKSWTRCAGLDRMFWCGLFVHRGALYLFGTSAEYGDIVIRRSTDGGRTWTSPDDDRTGLLFPGGPGQEPPNYHCAPVPVLMHRGRLWRAFEDCDPCVWGPGFRSFVLSAPEDADLLRSDSWLMTCKVAYDQESDPPEFAHDAGGGPVPPGAGWLEGNVVADRDGQLWNILRCHSYPAANRAVMLRVAPDGRGLSLDPATGFIEFPGGMSKFTIRYDPVSDRYWTISNHVTIPENPFQRNVLGLHSSADLRRWRLERTLLADPEDFPRLEWRSKTGFQYVDWQFEGEDIFLVSRTAYRGAHNFHDANYVTFHWLRGFRSSGATV